MPEVVAIRMVDDPRDVIHRAVQLLSAGELVALPTETAYVVGAHALMPDAVQRLQAMHGNSHSAITLALKASDEALDYVPRMSKQGRKLTRRCWPGPVTFCFQTANDEGLMQSLPSATRNTVVLNDEICLRVSANDVVLSILQLLPAPLLLSPETVAGAAATTAAELVDRNHQGIALAIDYGPCRYGQPSTVVQICADDWKLVKPGVVSETTLTRLASEMYLFVCTGNTCRSPMAEGLFRKLLSEKLQCGEDDLIDRGFMVASAGIAAASGAPASQESVELLKRQGIDIHGHASQPLTHLLLEQADRIYTMTRSHRDSILIDRPDSADRVALLARNGADISDPIGGGIDEYERCEAQIEKHIRDILDEIQTT